ncbi:MAG: hypothetical protein AB2L24_00380 [Mangrovibacterium sp.]
MTQQERPPLLLAALLLSFIGSSMGTLIYFTAAIFFDQSLEIIEELTNIQTSQKIAPLYFVIFGTMYCLSLIGVLKMYKMQKAGYFFYISAQICLLIVPLLWIGLNAFSATNTIFTVLFITIYSVYLKEFK